MPRPEADRAAGSRRALSARGARERLHAILTPSRETSKDRVCRFSCSCVIGENVVFFGKSQLVLSELDVLGRLHALIIDVCSDRAAFDEHYRWGVEHQPIALGEINRAAKF